MSIRNQRILTIAILIIAILVRLIPGPRTIDDSYITYRYARNILAGNGFVYNPGQPIQGTTTPLYTLIMAGMGFLFGGTQADFPTLSYIFNALADGLTCLLILSIGRKTKAIFAGYGSSLVWVIAPYSVTFAIGGLETSLFVLLLTAAAWAYLTGKMKVLALTSALALLTRPDAILLLVPIALAWGWQIIHKKSSIHLSEILIFSIPVLLWYGYAWLTFGNPLPHSVQAKLIAYRLEPYSAMIRLIQHYATPFLEHILLTTKWIGIGIILYPFLFLLGARKIVATQKALLPWLIYPWLYFLAFSIPNPLIFRWYLTPPLPAYFFGILFGAELILLKVIRNSPKPLLQKALPIALIVILPVLSTLQGWELKPDHGPKRPAPTMAWFKLEELYRQASAEILPLIDDQTRLAAGDVGVLGYYTPVNILDTVGLNSNEALQYYPLDPKYYVINYAIAPNLIIDEQPEWVIFLEVYGRNGLLLDQRFVQNYSLFKKIDTDIYGSNGLLIYQCQTCK